MRNAVIFANGEMPYPHLIVPLIPKDAMIIAADGGLRHTLALGLRPDHLVGDLDSVTAADTTRAEESKTQVTRFGSEKDETDLELCLDLALNSGMERCLLIGALGGRMDHALANVFLLFAEKYANMALTLTDGVTFIGRADPRVTIAGSAGELVTLIPWGGPVKGVTTYGLRYPLQNEALLQGIPRGVSNELLSTEATVQVQTGNVLYIHIKNGEKIDEK